MIYCFFQTRNRAEAWRVIAYIPREKNYYSKKEYKKMDPNIKTLRLQQLYNAALQNLKQIQSDESLNNIELRLDDKSKTVNLKIPIMFIIGDNQGGDALCGRHIFYGKTARRISRMCDAGPHHLNNPEIGSCQRIIMQDVMDCVINDDSESLYELYQLPHWIAWIDLDYGGNP